MSREEELRFCLARLAELQEELNATLAIFGKGTILSGERKILAQERLTALKERFKEEASLGEDELNQTEKAFYSRGVRHAYSSIHVRYNSRPDQKWIDQLLTARSSLALAASQAEGVLRKLAGKKG